MTTPTPELDQRFSDPSAGPTDWARTRDIVADAQLFWITTVRADGRPHVTPLVAVWLDDAVFFTTGPDEQKAINLTRNPNVALAAATGSWEDGLDVVIEGRAEPVSDTRLLERLADAWSLKWDGRWQYQVESDDFFHHAGGSAIVFRVKPTKVLAFGQGGFSQTRYVFD
jgi:nitroimidazol reductase NimA-like FMN-containing flavoprotein (pyridoxamine 5'-phosphate oxidase superfamily)